MVEAVVGGGGSGWCLPRGRGWVVTREEGEAGGGLGRRFEAGEDRLWPRRETFVDGF